MSNTTSNMLLAQAKPDPGFKLPEAGAAGSASALSNTPPPGPAASGLQEAPPLGAPDGADTSSRDLAIGGGIFLVLLVVYFFARNAFVNHLVVRRVAPSSAGSAGWLLFLGLAFISGAAVLAIINSVKYLSLIITGPLLLVGICCLIGTALVGRR